jgi:hypothetical protein
LALVTKRVLLVWKTTLLPTLFRDAGLLLAETALKRAKVRFAIRLQTINNRYPLVQHINLRFTVRGRNINIARRKTKIYILRVFLLEIPRLYLQTLYFSMDYRTNPTRRINKKTAAIIFKE